MRSVLAVYGNVVIPRVRCPECGEWALVVMGYTQCCDAAAGDAEPERYQRVSPPAFRRKLPTVEERKQIMEDQGHCCIYCDRTFGSSVWYKRRKRVLRVEWDHMLPWNYSQYNGADNFAAACQICNRIKSDLIFRSVEEIRLHVHNYWENNQTMARSEVPGLLEEVRDEG